MNELSTTTLQNKVDELREVIHKLHEEKTEFENTITSMTSDTKKLNEMISQRDLIIESMNDTHDNTNTNDNDDNELKKLKDVITQKDDVIKILQDQIQKLAQSMVNESNPKKANKTKGERKSFDAPATAKSSSNNNNDADWIEALDENGNKYWYNVSTGQTSWDSPASMGQPRVIGDWSEQFDDLGNAYWVNMVTGESSWELPS